MMVGSTNWMGRLFLYLFAGYPRLAMEMFFYPENGDVTADLMLILL